MKISKKTVHQALACIPALCSVFMTGVGWGWVAPTLLKLQNGDADFWMTGSEASWLASISEAGRMLGPFVSPLFVDNIGRRNTLALVSVTFFGVWCAVIFVRNTYILLLTRIVFGIGNGVSDVASTVYTTEISSPNLRGIFSSAVILACLFGLTFEFFVASYLSYTTTAIMNTALAIGAICLQYSGVETVYFLTAKGKHEQARKNLTWLEVDHPDIEGELRKIRANVEEEKRKKASLRLLFTSATNMKAIFAVVGFGLLVSTVGFHTVIPYASLIFSPSEMLTANDYTIMFGVTQLLGTVASFFVVERFDRRPLIIFAFVIIAGCNIFSCVLLYLRGKHYNYPWSLFACLAIYGFFGSMTGSAAYALTGEILPLSVRVIGGSLAIAAQSIGSFVTSIIFWHITERFGMECNFCIYVAASLLMIVFVYWVLPETRGKSLHDMHRKTVQSEHA